MSMKTVVSRNGTAPLPVDPLAPITDGPLDRLHHLRTELVAFHLLQPGFEVERFGHHPLDRLAERFVRALMFLEPGVSLGIDRDRFDSHFHAPFTYTYTYYTLSGRPCHFFSSPAATSPTPPSRPPTSARVSTAR